MVLGIGFYIYRLARKRIENFQAGPESYVTEKTSEYEVKPFKECAEKVKADVIKHLQKEWQQTGVKYSIDFVEKTWTYPDAIYVMVNTQGEFIGCSAIDRSYMGYPFISHIYVKKQYRKKGFGEKLFNVVVKHAQKVGHKQVYGFCKDELVDYYKTFGCRRQATSGLLKPLLGDFNLMTLKL